MRIPATKATAVLTALAVGGCSVFHPQYYQPHPGSDPTQLEFNQAVDRANKLFASYAKGRDEMRLYAFASGVTLYALVVAGLGLALFQAPNNALLGVGLAGAGVGGLRAFLPFDSRQKAYASGQKAINCSVIALSLGQSTPQAEAKVSKEPEQGEVKGPVPEPGGQQTPGSTDPNHESASDVSGTVSRTTYQSDLTRLRKRLEGLRAGIEGRSEPGGRESAVAGREAAVVRREGALTSTLGGLVESVGDLENAVNPAATDLERAQSLDSALLAIDLAVQDQLDAAEVDPQKASAAAGNSVGPFLTTLTQNVALARAQTRQLRNEAAVNTILASDKQQAAAQKSGTEAAQANEAAAELSADAKKAQEAAAIADSALNKIWSLTKLPAECLGGFAAAAQQSGQQLGQAGGTPGT